MWSVNPQNPHSHHISPQNPPLTVKGSSERQRWYRALTREDDYSQTAAINIARYSAADRARRAGSSFCFRANNSGVITIGGQTARLAVGEFPFTSPIQGPFSKAYIPPGVSFTLRWQLSPMQMKFTCSANDSSYVLYDFFFNQNLVNLGHV